LFSSPITKNVRQRGRDVGILSPRISSINQSVAAAKLSRSATIVKGGNSVTAMPIKKNEPPQSIESKNSIAHSLIGIDVRIKDELEDGQPSMAAPLSVSGVMLGLLNRWPA
jgi:hypothetical protein